MRDGAVSRESADSVNVFSISPTLPQACYLAMATGGISGAALARGRGASVPLSKAARASGRRWGLASYLQRAGVLLAPAERAPRLLRQPCVGRSAHG